MNLEFCVYDNNETYNKIKGNDTDKKQNRFKIKDIWIKPPEKAFWFATDMEKENRHPNLRALYVHLHNGTILPYESVQYDRKMAPILIQKHWLHFNPKKKELLIKNSILPWQKPLWTKHIQKFYSQNTPHKTMKVLGNWSFDYTRNSVDFILNWYSSRKLDDDEQLHINAS